MTEQTPAFMHGSVAHGEAQFEESVQIFGKNTKPGSDAKLWRGFRNYGFFKLNIYVYFHDTMNLICS